MSFEIYKQTHVYCHPLGKTRIGKGRYVSFASTDLESVGITNFAVILIDREHRIIALRKPNSNDPVGVAVNILKNKSGLVRRVALSGPLAQLGEQRTRREIDLIIRDDLVQIPLGCRGFPEVKRRSKC